MTKTERWDGGGRLRDAITIWHGGPGGIESFVAALQQRAEQMEVSIPGANRAMVQRYLGGAAEPSVGFLAHAADVLGCRAEWLAFDRGARTDEEEAARLGVTASLQPTLPEPEPIQASTPEEMLHERFPGFESLPAWAKENVREACRRIAEDQLSTRDLDETALERARIEEEMYAAFYVARALSVPLERPGVDWSFIWPHQRGLYAAAVAQGLMYAVPSPADRLVLDPGKRRAIG